MTDLDAAFPDKLQCLFTPRRFKVLYGGRAAGRSWGCARAALLMGSGMVPGTRLTAPLPVLCAREFQNSIAESIHKLLCNQIDLLGLNAFYEVQRDRIIGKLGTSAAGTYFVFEGIKNNVTRIKSYEGIKLCLVEEAIKVSQSSWGVLIPTIRTEGSEIWMNFNPELESDYTYRRFVLEADDSMIVVRMTWRDNPWLPQVIREEIERDRVRDPDYYLNVWEGHCLQQLEGSVYAKELRRCTEDGRVTVAPYDPEWPVETAWDLGRADATAIWFYQRIAMQHRVIDFFEGRGEDIDFYIRELKSRRYIYGRHWLPHDARARRLGSKRTIEEIIRNAWPEGVYIVPRLTVADGINAARLLLMKCWFNEKTCEDGLRALRHYQYRLVDDPTDPLHRGQRSNEPLHDWSSHAADAFRMMAIAAGQGTRVDAIAAATRDIVERERRGTSWSNAVRTASLGWMR